MAEEAFPGEGEVLEKAEEAVDEGRCPWMVARRSEGNPMHMEIVMGGFKLATDADQWIKDHIEEDEVLCSVREGKAFTAKVEKIRKVREVQ